RLDYNSLLAGNAKVQVSVENRLLVGAGLAKDFACRGDDLAATDKPTPALYADPISREHVDPILPCARTSQEIRRRFGPLGPVRRQNNDVSACQRQHPRGLGETNVVAYERRYVAERRVPDRKMATGRHEPVGAEHGQMAFAV